ncbi:MAG: hypothetical protein ABSE73_16450 [Planctomycetota bacterium]
METMRKDVVIQERGKLMLTGLPFKKGEAVEVLVRAKVDRKKLAAEMRALFKRTQALPQAKTISDEDIQAEIAAYRAGR